MIPNSEILFTRQKHNAKKAGLHYDYRIVIGDKAYSWATKKELPEEGKSIILHEQPVHTSDYALSKHIEIPDGQYGAGVTTLDWVKKGKIQNGEDHYVIYTNDGQKFLLKHLPDYGEKQWLFKNLGYNKYLKKVASLHTEFKPDLTPKQMEMLGVLSGKYFEGDPNKNNLFKTDASMKEWPEAWHNDQHPMGWYQWYQGYSSGKRTDDDERQIKRWISFKARHLAQLKKADPTLTNLEIQPRRRQALLHWGIAPGDLNLYLKKKETA